MSTQLLKQATEYYQQGMFEPAQKIYLQLLEQYPHHAASLCYNLATCYLQLNDKATATEYYLQAIRANPKDCDSYYNLGVIALQNNELAVAENYFRLCLINSPQYATAYANLGAIYLKLGHHELALEYYRSAQRYFPDNPTINYMIAALTGEKSFDVAPTDYVKNLFDNYADHYDQHIEQMLNYQLPGIIEQTLKTHHVSEQNCIVDLGCGTGLCGEKLRPLTDNLIGIDISTEMLALAQQKNYYDILLEADCNDVVPMQPETVDLLVAADVLVYIGNLSSLLKNCFEVLVTHGLMLFTTERNETEDFILQSSGRYAHSPTYVIQIAQEQGFTLLHQETITVRYQDNQPVVGELFLLKKCRVD